MLRLSVSTVAAIWFPRQQRAVLITSDQEDGRSAVRRVEGIGSWRGNALPK